jgi:hypothetical protein
MEGFRLEVSVVSELEAIATPTGAAPTATILVTALVAVSMTKTESEPKLGA